MFDNIGWPEIFVVLILAVIIIGPEKLPDVIKDVRAAIFAARRAIANARAELDGLSGEFDELKEPIAQAAEWGRLGPRRAISKALFDGDDDALNDLDPKKFLADTGIKPNETPAQAARRLRREADTLEHQANQSASPSSPASADSQTTSRPAAGEKPASPGNFATGGGISWTDIT